MIAWSTVPEGSVTHLPDLRNRPSNQDLRGRSVRWPSRPLAPCPGDLGVGRFARGHGVDRSPAVERRGAGGSTWPRPTSRAMPGDVRYAVRA